MTSEVKQKPTFVIASFGQHRRQWVKIKTIQSSYLFIEIIWSKVCSSTKPTVFLPTFILDFKVTIVEVKSRDKWIARMNNWAYSCCEEWQLVSFKVVTPVSHLCCSCWWQIAINNRNIYTSFLKYFSCNKKNYIIDSLWGRALLTFFQLFYRMQNSIIAFGGSFFVPPSFASC